MARESGFSIHVDSSCVTDSTDLKKPSKRNDSSQTVIHNEPEDIQSEIDESQLGSEVSRDEHTEALIHAAARAVIASIEHDSHNQDDSVLSARTEEEYEDEVEGDREAGTELTYDSDVGHSNHDPYDGSVSSNHEDDVFSQGTRSNRSSLNSYTDEEALGKHGENNQGEHLKQIEHTSEHNTPISRMPSAYSQDFALLPQPLTITSSTGPHTPAKVVSRPPFRTPSSVRAMQMSSPTTSIFSGSPRSIKRPTVSRLGTPQAHDSSPTKKTPMKFKAKKEYPLVLLHVTVLPLHWSYGDVMDATSGEGLQRELHGVRESWRLLQEKLGDIVLERGILLAHPQDSYEVLEERLLEALELPVRPRAKILSCGHYLGPDDMDDSASEDDYENEDESKMIGNKEKWCDICNREVMYQELGLGGKQKRFRIKVYASNGLMRAGAWAAAWREMERVDVEIAPFVPSHLVAEMDSLTTFHSQTAAPPTFDHVDVEEQHHNHEDHEQKYPEQEEAMRRRQMDEERMREIYGDNPPPPSPEAHEARSVPEPPLRRQEYGDSLPKLLLAALKVVLRDQKQVAIYILSILILFLALRPSGVHTSTAKEDLMPTATAVMPEFTTHAVEAGQEMMASVSQAVAEMPTQVVAAVKAVADEAIAVTSKVEDSPRAASEDQHERLRPQKQKCVLVDESPPSTEGLTIKTAETKVDESPPNIGEDPTMKTVQTHLEDDSPNTEEGPAMRKAETKRNELEAGVRDAVLKVVDEQEEKEG